MKHLTLIASFVLASLALGAQTGTETRELKPFTRLHVLGGAYVQYIQSDSTQSRVYAEYHQSESGTEQVSITSDGETLVIKTKGNENSRPVKVYARSLKEVVCSSASHFESTNTITADSLVLDASGAAKIELSTTARAINATSSGASGIDLAGTTNSLYATVSGASTLKAYKLEAKFVEVTATGASSAKVTAIDKIRANATGASSVKFKGEPKDVSVEASASSSIAKIAGETAQKSEGRDTTTFNLGRRSFIIIDRDWDHDEKDGIDEDDFHHWAGFSMGVNGWVSGNGSFNLPQDSKYMSLNYGKSLNFQLNPFERNFKLYKNYIHLVTGLGFEWNQYEFSNPVTLEADSSYTAGYLDSTGINYRKNRLKSTFVNEPLMIEFNTNKDPKHSFHVALGVIGGYKLGSRTRQVYQADGHTAKDVRRDSYNINPIRVNAHLSVGYSDWTFFADYALTPLFESGKGPNLNPVTFGLRIVPF